MFLLLTLAGLLPAADLKTPPRLARPTVARIESPAQNINRASVTKPVPPPALRYRSRKASAFSVDSVVWEGALLWKIPGRAA